MKRKLFLDAYDVEKITHFSLGYCRYLLRRTRSHYGKESYQKVTLKEFTAFMGLDEAEVREVLYGGAS